MAERNRPNTWSDGSRYNPEGYRRDGAKKGFGFSRRDAGEAGSSLDKLNAMQNRSLPAFYSPNRVSPYPTAGVVATVAEMAGVNVLPNGTVAPNVPNLPPVPAAMPAATGSDYWMDRISGNVPWGGAAQPVAPAIVPQTGPTPNVRTPVNISGQADAIRANRERMMAQEQAALYTVGEDPLAPMATKTTLTSPYGTGSSTTAPRRGPATFGPGQQSASDFFGNAATRQGRDNKFAKAPPPKGYKPLDAKTQGAMSEQWRRSLARI